MDDPAQVYSVSVQCLGYFETLSTLLNVVGVNYSTLMPSDAIETEKGRYKSGAATLGL